MYVLAILSYYLYWQIISLLIYVTRIRLHEQIDTSRLESRVANEDVNSAEFRMELTLISYEDVLWQFREFIRNRLRFAGVLLVAAPLLGLLGTVLGMLDMFHGLSLRAGHQTTILVAEGVKQSLITTQTGLTIAIPAIFFIYWIRRVSNSRELELLERRVLSAESQLGQENA